jgi:hypothetical protein
MRRITYLVICILLGSAICAYSQTGRYCHDTDGSCWECETVDIVNGKITCHGPLGLTCGSPPTFDPCTVIPPTPTPTPTPPVVSGSIVSKVSLPNDPYYAITSFPLFMDIQWLITTYGEFGETCFSEDTTCFKITTDLGQGNIKINSIDIKMTSELMMAQGAAYLVWSANGMDNLEVLGSTHTPGVNRGSYRNNEVGLSDTFHVDLKNPIEINGGYLWINGHIDRIYANSTDSIEVAVHIFTAGFPPVTLVNDNPVNTHVPRRRAR